MEPLNTELLGERTRMPRVVHRDKPGIVAFLSLATLLWVACLATGCALYNGGKPNRSVGLLAAYDRVFRTAGALLPFAVVALRVGLHQLLQGCALPEGEEQRNILVVYAGMTLARALLYNMLLKLAGAWTPPGMVLHQYMSDHVFLAACISAQLCAEGAIALRLARGARSRPAMCAAGWALLALCALLLALTGGEVYTTARYYHPGREIAVAAVAGGAIFQGPLVWWLTSFLPLSPGF